MLPIMLLLPLTQPPPVEEGFVALSADAELTAWRLPRTGAWECRDNVIRRVTGGTLFTRRVSEDFTLRLDYRIGTGGNSGVFLRAPLSGRHSALGMELQIMGDHGRPPTNQSSGALYAARAPLVAANGPDDEWNALEVTLAGRHLRATLNGQVIHDFDLDDPEANRGLAPGIRLADRCPRGFIGLQDHGAPVEFRNVRLREAPEEGFSQLRFGRESQDGVLELAEGMERLTGMERLGDYEARLEFRVEPGAQAVWFARLDNDPKHAPLEIALADDTGRAPGREASGALLGTASTMTAASLPLGEWNDLRCVFEGWTVRVYLNEMPVLQVPSANLWGKFMYTPLQGVPGLEARKGKVEVRRVRVRPL
jgi:hypothetical protein